MDQKYLAEIKAREQAATPGPWRVIPNSSCAYSIFNTTHTVKMGSMYLNFDAQFIAHARTDIPALIAEVERLNEVISSMDDMHTRIMRAEEQKLNHISVERNAYMAKNATLKKALEMTCCSQDYTPSGHTLMDYYTQQAQEQEGQE